MKREGFKDIGIDDLAFTVPANWDAMSLGQLRFLAQLLQTRRTSFEVCTMMLMHGIGGMIVSMPVMDHGTVVKLRGRRFALTVDQVSQLAETYSFLFDDLYAPDPNITPALTVNPFPEVRRGSLVLRGPSDGMLEISFGSYMWLQTYMSGVRTDPDNMNAALACLWKHDTGSCEPSEVDIDVISRLPAWQRMVMFWFVSGCLSRMQRLFPRVFSGGGGTGGNVLDQQLRLLDSLAQGDMTKKNLVRQGKLVDALYVIDESLRKMEEREREMAKRKTT